MFSTSYKAEARKDNSSKHSKLALFPASIAEQKVLQPMGSIEQWKHIHRISTQGLGESDHLGNIARPEKYMLQNGNVAELLVNFEKESDTKGNVNRLFRLLVMLNRLVINIKAGDKIVVGRQDDRFVQFHQKIHQTNLTINTSNFQLSSLVASNHHFKIYTVVIDEEHDVLVYCEDMSLNGTYFNSQLIGKGKKVLLSDGDELRKSFQPLNHACFIKR